MDEKETPSNVVPIRRGPGSIATRFRMGKNAFWDKLLGPEQVNYKTGESNYDDEPDFGGSEDYGPIVTGPETPLGKHLANAIRNSGDIEGSLNEMLGRNNADFTEARLHHINEGKEIKHRKSMKTNE